ncbi:MAG: hypothetical protein OER86_02335 [Phycisphaerae bacterium]|nr:hypothetical protein [Phycisphaerae bacterium]
MKAPPTYPNLPVATDDDPNIAGITILSSRDAGSMNEWVFKINRGEEDVAINGLLDALQTISEFSLADHSRNDYESCATYEKDGAGYRMMVGGHGWSGDWKTLDSASAIAAATEQMRYNYGTAWHDCGRIVRRK